MSWLPSYICLVSAPLGTKIRRFPFRIVILSIFFLILEKISFLVLVVILFPIFAKKLVESLFYFSVLFYVIIKLLPSPFLSFLLAKCQFSSAI
jgi:nitrate reductase NapE component